MRRRRLSFAERGNRTGPVAGRSIRRVAARLGRSPSTISRELGRSTDRTGRYRAGSARWPSAGRAADGETGDEQVLRERVQTELTKRYSPEQIAGRLREITPTRPEMWVSTETIYQSLYVQSRGALRRDLTRCCARGGRCGSPTGKGARRKNRVLPDIVNISERPAEAVDRAVPGHWEGDLIIGKANASAIGTLVEALPQLPAAGAAHRGFKAEQVAPALAAKINTLPDQLRRTLTWDQSVEDAGTGNSPDRRRHRLYFDKSPWRAGDQREHQRAAAAVLPKGTDLSVHTEAHLDAVAAELNDRPANVYSSRSRSN